MERNSTIAAWRLPGRINWAAHKAVSAVILSYHDSVPPRPSPITRLKPGDTHKGLDAPLRGKRRLHRQPVAKITGQRTGSYQPGKRPRTGHSNQNRFRC